MDIKILFRGILFIFIIIILFISLVLIYLLIVSRGQVEKFTDFQGNILENSLAEKIFEKMEKTL